MAYFLAEHKRELGRKCVTGIRIFHCDTDHKTACAYLSIGDVAQGQVGRFSAPGNVASADGRRQLEKRNGVTRLWYVS